MITDSQYYEFLHKLLADQRGKNSLNLTEWEQRFLASFSMAQRQTLWLTGDLKTGRRAAVDRLWRRYGPELNFPHPLDTVTERPKLEAADPDGCEYLIRDEGRQRRCNDPAEVEEPGKLRYCRMHGEAVEKAMKRTGRRIALIKFQSPAKSSIANRQSSIP